MNSLKADSVIFLLGAGCSVDAEIKASFQMIDEIEQLIKSDDKEWNRFCDLYYYVKSAILYADGIQGLFDNNVNIERLVGVLRDLKKKEKNPIYPFIGAWNEKLLELAGEKFSHIDKFDKKLSSKIVEFVTLNKDTERRVSYYKKFYEFQRSIESSLRIFSLNYDQCVEKAKPADYELECGFNEHNIWSSDRFTETSINAGIYLYKLHGSIDWMRDESKGNILVRYDSPQIKCELIFGTDAKLQSVDPFLFNVYEFRNHSLISKLIIIIGYSFNDPYVNDLLAQALNHLDNRKLLVVDYRISNSFTSDMILTKLKLDLIKHKNQVIVKNMTARQFLEKELITEKIEIYLKDEDDVF